MNYLDIDSVNNGFWSHLVSDKFLVLQKYCFYTINILTFFSDPPGTPGTPECTGTTEDSITLSWDPPTKDGGKPIKGYVLEKREKGSKKWTK